MRQASRLRVVTAAGAWEHGQRLAARSLLDYNNAMNLRTILVAVDGSARAPAVLAAAVEVGARFSATLRLLRVAELPPELPPAAAGVPADPLPAHLTKLVTDELRQLALQVDPGTTLGEPIVRFGQPWRVILEVARELDADLVIVGSHGYHGWDHVLGTTAGNVANRADRSVLVVHERGVGPSARVGDARG